MIIPWLKIGLIAGAVAALIGGLTFLYLHVRGIGYDQCKLEWAEADRRGLEQGLRARRDAERDVDSGRLPDHDRFNRD